MFAIFMCDSLKRSRDQCNLLNWFSVNFQEYLLHHILGETLQGIPMTTTSIHDAKSSISIFFFSIMNQFWFSSSTLPLKFLIISMIMFWYCIISIDHINNGCLNLLDTIKGSFLLPCFQQFRTSGKDETAYLLVKRFLREFKCVLLSHYPISDFPLPTSCQIL